MALIRSGRTNARAGQTHLVPGGLACAASARRAPFSPTPLTLSPSLKAAASVFASKTVTRLAVGYA